MSESPVTNPAPTNPSPTDVKPGGVDHWTGAVLVVAIIVMAAGLAMAARMLGPIVARRNAANAAKSPPAVRPTGHAVADFQLIERSGRSVTRQDLVGKVWIANFMFTSCTTACPMMARRLQSLQRTVADAPDVVLVTFTIDPRHDTPERLQEYAKMVGADADRWLFLTGEQTVIHDLGNKTFMLSVRETSPDERGKGFDAFTHSRRFVLVDRDGRVYGYYDSEDESDLARLRGDALKLSRGAQS